LRARGFIYPCACSRKDVINAATAPHDSEADEPIYPGSCRVSQPRSDATSPPNWRFRVPDGEALSFVDDRLGRQTALAGRDFGDFIVWRRDDVPSYQLAVVVDDAAMGITEVVRGEDLRLSTFRQLLLYRALDLEPPRFFHTRLLRDATGRRLAKRNAALTLRALRASGKTPADVRAND
jgi:glutamyl-tRNA synthetase